ncbi:MAG: hypothetical protein GXP22_00390, partial [Gammaproteobacteria bacterium]|nr:hypothetical protein [Gammaproteobacteria bacterium]
DHTTGNLTYDSLNVHDNLNTGMYMNASYGTNIITNCMVYDNGKIDGNTDRGGIGIQGGNITIINNEIWNNGPNDGDADMEISVAGATGTVDIIENYIHDCLQGCIQIADGGHGSTIANNVISGFSETTATTMTSRGKWSGIRIGGGGIGGDVQNIRIYNNIITGGITPKNDVGIHAGRDAAIFVSRFNNSGLSIKNNIIYNNEIYSVYIDYSARFSDVTDFIFDNNIYETSDNKAKLNWQTRDKYTLDEWKTSALEDGLNLDTNTSTRTPEIVADNINTSLLNIANSTRIETINPGTYIYQNQQLLKIIETSYIIANLPQDQSLFTTNYTLVNVPISTSSIEDQPLPTIEPSIIEDQPLPIIEKLSTIETQNTSTGNEGDQTIISNDITERSSRALTPVTRLATRSSKFNSRRLKHKRSGFSYIF